MDQKDKQAIKEKIFKEKARKIAILLYNLYKEKKASGNLLANENKISFSFPIENVNTESSGRTGNIDMEFNSLDSAKVTGEFKTKDADALISFNISNLESSEPEIIRLAQDKELITMLERDGLDYFISCLSSDSIRTS